MKKKLGCIFFVICVTIAVIYMILSVIGINIFSNIDSQVEEDYSNHKEVFEQFVETCSDDTYMTMEVYDKSSESACKIFEDLQYQYIRVSHGYVFFCKGDNAMTGIGLVYHKSPFEANSKQKVIKTLEKHWLIMGEHYL